MAEPRFTPTGLRAPHGGRTMEITWADGHVSKLPHATLRGFCPCAHCQGHQGPIRFVPGGDEELREIERVGAYALRFVWGDFHDAGLYTFRYLRDLDGRQPDAPPANRP